MPIQDQKEKTAEGVHGNISDGDVVADVSVFDREHMKHALAQAEIGLKEGGVPIGAALVTVDGIVLGVGRNKRVQCGSVIRHGEMDCFENAGRLSAKTYRECTMFTTLSPCSMCTGAIVLFGIKRVVIGENSTFLGPERTLHDHGVEVVNLDLPECKEWMSKFIAANPTVWNEDIGEL